MRSGAEEVEPLYDTEDAACVLKQFRPCSYGTMVQVNDAVSIRLTDVGHLLGSSAIEVWLREDGQTKKICFSGDIGNTDQPILKDPQHVAEADYLVIESTYGDRLHSIERVDYVSELAARIQKVLDRGGNMVIPSFAAGRSQEILCFIRQIKTRGLVTGHGDFPVYMDSPLAIEATGIFLQCDTAYLDEEMRDEIRSGINPLMFPGLKLAVSQRNPWPSTRTKHPRSSSRPAACAMPAVSAIISSTTSGVRSAWFSLSGTSRSGPSAAFWWTEHRASSCSMRKFRSRPRSRPCPASAATQIKTA